MFVDPSEIVGGGGNTNLGYVSSDVDGTVTSDTGSDATIPLASGVGASNIAGLLSPAGQDTINNTSGTNTGDQNSSTVSFTPDGDISATDVQSAIVEVRDDTDTKISNITEGHVIQSDSSSLTQRVNLNFKDRLQGEDDGGNNTTNVNFVNEAELIFESNLTNLVTFNVKAQINNDLAVELSQLTITKYETKLAATENDSSYVERADLSALQTYLNTTVADGTTVTVRVSAIVSSNNQYGFAKFSWTKK